MSKFRKILTGFSALALAVALMPMFAAFEAHVINVTAKIENALSVPTEALNFGTVFPQEQLEKILNISLSQSFLDERDADDVEYIIRQKPKCAVTNNNGTTLVGPTWTGHIVPAGPTSNEYTVDCEADAPENLATVLQQNPGSTAGLLPSLCEYVSKHPDGTPSNDGSLDSFHKSFTVSNGEIGWNDVEGRLARSEQDTADNWTIDLAVPCFGGQCAQDWANYVHTINPNVPLDEANQWTQPTSNEHKIFGCNLWVEVTKVSRFGQPTVGADLTAYVQPTTCDVTVNPNDQNLNTIQEAIAMAGQNPLGQRTVCVPDGTYSGMVPIEIVGLSLVGLNGPTNTATIDGVIEIRANDVTVKGFKITGGVSTAPDFAGIYVWANTSGHTIKDNIIDGTDAASSRGILFGYDVSNILVTNNVVSDWFTGGYINPTTVGNIDFTFNDFESNTVGIGSDGITDVAVNNNEFDSNTVEAIGLGDFERNTSLVVINTNNFIPAGAGNNVNAYELNAAFEVLATDATNNWWDGEAEAARTNDTATVDTEPAAGSIFLHN